MDPRSITSIPNVQAEPDFDNLLQVLKCGKPKRPTLFEFFLNMELYDKLVYGDPNNKPASPLPLHVLLVRAFRNAGYDYVTIGVPGFGFPAGEINRANTISLNDGAMITDSKSLSAYKWLDPDDAQYDVLDSIANELPDGMQIIISGPGGVEENVIRLVGYDNLCYMMCDEPDLAAEIFAHVGSRLVRYYENAGKHPRVGACISNDDWGFKTSTLLSMKQMRQYLFPWHKRIVEAIHAAGKPAILHSCGYYGDVIDIVIDELKYDGRHSYEDAIQPVEEAYDRLNGRVAVLGGIDVDFICRSTPEEVYDRSKAMLARSSRGGYGLGTGNSVPSFVPQENYFAMINAALDQR